MLWKQINIIIDQDHVETLSTYLSQYGALSVTWQDAEDDPIYEPELGETRLWKLTKVTGLFESDVIEVELDKKIKALGIVWKAYQWEQLPDQDWERAWLDNFKPMQFGQHLWIIPSGFDAPDSKATNVALDPGLAFGTGTHATTALCLEWLDQTGLAEKIVIDYGCGSGVLAVAAALLGAAEVWAIDNDPQAIMATKDNANKNNVTFIQSGLPDELPDIQVDIILANILATPLISLSARFSSLLKSKGCVVLSGILSNQQDMILNAYQSAFNILSVSEKDGWLRIVAEKK